MENVIWLIIGIICIVLALFIQGWLSYRAERNKSISPFYLFALMMLPATGMAIIGAREIDKPINASEKRLKTEVRLKITNGKETSRDTVYIFTPKKK